LKKLNGRAAVFRAPDTGVESGAREYRPGHRHRSKHCHSEWQPSAQGGPWLAAGGVFSAQTHQPKTKWALPGLSRRSRTAGRS